MSCIQQPDLVHDATYQEHAKWAKNYKPAPDESDELVLDHARRVYDECVMANQRLDKKAEDILKTAGVLVTILLATAGASSAFTPCWIIPSLICFLLAMVLSIVSRQPKPRSSLSSIRQTIERLPSENRQLYMAVSLHWAVEKLSRSIGWKAQALRRASWCLCLGVLGFLFPIVAWSTG